MGDASSQMMVSSRGFLTFNVSNTGSAKDATERMRITSSGNVGIGTDSPGAQLHNYSTATQNVWISGYGTLAQNNWGAGHAIFAAQDNGLLISKANAANNTNRLFSLYHDGGGNAEFYMYDTNSNNKVLINSSGNSFFNGGNVGVGTTSPGYPLDVASVEVAARFTGSQTGHTQGAILLSSGTADTPQARGQGVYRFNEGNDETWYTGTAYANTNRYIWARKSSTTSFDSSAASLTYAMMSLTNDGKLGIGITNPQDKLHVDGDAIISSNRYGDYSTGGLDTTGVVVATITGSGNGASASIEFVGMGGVNGIVDVVYNCTNQGGNWYVYKNERQTATTVDVVATGNGTTTLTFTFKAISSSQGYTPRLRMIGSPYNLITF
jgi:hypothetical protein